MHKELADSKKAMNAKFARAVKNGEVIHATSLSEKTDRGLACNCTCVECGKAVQFVTQRIPSRLNFSGITRALLAGVES
jgi:hypothetical protein